MRKHLFSFIAAASLLFAGGGQSAWAWESQAVYKVTDNTGTVKPNGTWTDANSVVTATYGPTNGETDMSVKSLSSSLAAVSGVEFGKKVTQNGGNPVVASETKVPTSGAYIKISPKYDGEITTVLSGVTKAIYMVEVANEVETVLSGTLTTTGATLSAGTATSSSYTGGIKYSVVAGGDYYFYVSGSKMNFAGFIYDYTKVDPNTVNITAETEYNGETGEYLVTFTAFPEGATITYKIGEESQTYTAPISVKPGITIKVSGELDGYTSLKDKEIVIPAIPKAADPTYVEQYDADKEQYLLTLTGATSYTIGTATEKTEYTTPFYVDPATKITAYANITNYAEASVAITVSAKPTVANPVASIVQNTAARNYTIALSSETADAVLSYTIGEETTQYTVPFIVEGGTTLSVVGTKKGYNNGTATFAPKAYPDANTDATEITVAGVKDVTQSGLCYTISSDYIAQPGANNGSGKDFSSFIKVRTNKTAGSLTGFRISVNEYYTISKVVVRGYGNGTAVVKISEVDVDGAKLESFTETALPTNTTQSDSEIRLTLSDLKATKSIDFGCTTAATNGTTQAILQFEFTYQLAAQPDPTSVKFDQNSDYSTFYSEKAVVIPANITAYTGTIDGSYVKLNEVTGTYIPAKTAVVLEGEAAASANFYPTSEQVAAIEGNDLKGVSEATKLENVYVLSYNEGKEDVGFYKASSVEVPANKAYIEVANEAAPVLRFNFGQEVPELGNVSGINAVSIENRVDNVIYDLRGRRVQSLDRPGLYIMNGKKISVK
jgi:hypothetical protein